MKFFTTAGPVNPDKHYYIPKRLNEQVIRSLIDQEKYFILHAPRQSGKTTGIKVFVEALNQEGTYKALYVNIEPAQAARGNFIEGIFSILELFKSALEKTFTHKDDGLNFFDQALNRNTISGVALFNFLEYWSKHSSKPIVLFIDEIDSLVGDTLISVLRQLRAGYTNRPKNFPQAMCLIGVRDVRDYLIWSDAEQKTILGGSAFNIKAESLELPDFSPEQVKDLYLQHTAEWGQKFTDGAIEHAFYLTQGQPWLTNALAYQACFADPATIKTIATPNPDVTITKEIIEQAKEALILQQDPHFNKLLNQLQHEPIRHLIKAIINNDQKMLLLSCDYLSYAHNAGLIDQNSLKIANPIYQEFFTNKFRLRDQGC